MKYPVIVSLFSCLTLCQAAEIPGVPRDSNFNNTGGYDSTRVEAQLLVPVKEDTRVVHFIRDNNDPRVVTKTYLLKHVDAYEFRDYLRQMVQAKRVGNTSMQQIYPGNTATMPYTATVSSAELTTPATAQPGYNPELQLGSNTAVECLKYVDGTGLLIISAEEYRFKDHDGGMGFDSLVEFLDKPQMGANYGTQTFFYIPKFVPARNLMPLIENVGMNITDVTEIWQGQDLVDDLVDGLLLDFLAAVGAVGGAHPGPQQAEVVVDLRHRAHGGAGVFAGGLLVDGDGRGQAVDVVHVGLLHLPQEHPGVGAEALHIAPLALGVDGVKGQRRLAAAGEAGEHHQLVPGDGDVDIFQVVGARALYHDLILHGSSSLAAVNSPPRAPGPANPTSRHHTRTNFYCQLRF